MTEAQKKKVKEFIKHLDAMCIHCVTLLRQVNDFTSAEQLRQYGAMEDPSEEIDYLSESAISLIEAEGAILKTISAMKKAVGIEEDPPAAQVLSLKGRKLAEVQP